MSRLRPLKYIANGTLVVVVFALIAKDQ